VVLLVTDHTLNPILNPAEVTHLFSMPLASFLHVHPSKIPGWHFGLKDRSAPFIPTEARPALTVPEPPPIRYALDEGVVGGKEGYYQYRDIKWGSGIVRMHRFLTGKEGQGIRPVYGLTA
jgi:coenzyme A diphosphatase NUDT7